MPGPFPGMDPFLEDRWGDVHTSLTTYARNQLQRVLPPDLKARVEEYVHLESEDGDDTSRFTPDVRVVERATVTAPVSTAIEPVGIIAATPLVLPMSLEWTERWVQILDRTGDRLVTTIEFLSPGNKQTAAQQQRFHDKQRRLLDAGTNLVEIDLLRQGGWALTVPEALVPESHRYPYRAVAIRASRPAHAECYAVPLRERLPAIRIPLRANEPDVVLDLQALIDAAWQDGGYDDIDYQRADMPRFAPADEAWLRERIIAWSA